MIQIDDNTFSVEAADLPTFVDNRPEESNKGTYGHVLLIAGSYGKMGAAVLAARACLRAGAGLVTVHVPRKGVDIMQTAVPEAMVSIDEDDCRWSHPFTPEELQRFDAIAAGPGLGTQSSEALRQLLTASSAKPLVLDADALNMLARMDDKLELLRMRGKQDSTVLTPHAKEFERLFGLSADDAARKALQKSISIDTGCVIVYKGHRSQITGKDGIIYLNTSGNAGMATAGSGDVLTGIVAAFLAQNKEYQIDASKCTALAVWMHGKSGDNAVQKQSKCSLTAGDIVENLRFVTM